MDHNLRLMRKREGRISNPYITKDLLCIFELRNVRTVKFLPFINEKLQFMLAVKKIPRPWQLASGFTIKIFFLFYLLCYST